MKYMVIDCSVFFEISLEIHDTTSQVIFKKSFLLAGGYNNSEGVYQFALEKVSEYGVNEVRILGVGYESGYAYDYMKRNSHTAETPLLIKYSISKLM